MGGCAKRGNREEVMMFRLGLAIALMIKLMILPNRFYSALAVFNNSTASLSNLS